ncbi:MAG: C4-type zinc ribbon domain-containing protein [Bacteroidales bacterium]|nr:C4-type zinc ribbon domain-containing protein [Bacteroidales bacterium]MDD4669516.1 C4-type zinc ribbon domain-containing protein [Bacteroidales bacterium]
MATKKVNKVIAPPIDPRETFISLSKNMGEADTIAMEQKLHTLYQIQLTDTQIDKIYLLRGELPLEVQDLEDEIAGLKTRISNLQAEIKETDRSISDYKHKIEDSKKAIAKYESQRDNVQNNREYDSLSKEIEYQELEKLACDKKIKEGNVFLAEKKATLDEAKSLLAGRDVDLVNKKKELETIVEETSKEEADLFAHRGELASKIDDRMMAAYTKVRSNAKNKLAVVTVKRDACGGCFNKIPPQRQLDIASSKKIIVCEYCGRILVSSDFEKE